MIALLSGIAVSWLASDHGGDYDDDRLAVFSVVGVGGSACLRFPACWVRREIKSNGLLLVQSWGCACGAHAAQSIGL